MAFEKFVQTARSFKAKLSIRSNGTIGFNSGAVNKFSLNGSKYAVLYFDAERRMIGIKPTVDESEDGAHKINQGVTGAWIAAKRFIDYHELSAEKTKRYDASWDAEEEMIVARVS